MGDPRETLRLVRLVELATGATSVVFGLVLWGEGWWHWVLIAAGLAALSPYPGPAAILRRAETHPEILNHDPVSGRRRANRMLAVMLPVWTVGAGVAGYLLDGWPAAIFMSVLIGGSGALGAGLFRWLSRR
jgi:hypothetical protein